MIDVGMPDVMEMDGMHCKTQMMRKYAFANRLNC